MVFLLLIIIIGECGSTLTFRGIPKSERLYRDPCECLDELGDILRKSEVSFASFSCILPTL